MRLDAQDGHFERPRLEHHLDRVAIARDDRPEALLPLDDIVKAQSQRRLVEGAAQPDRAGPVEGRRRGLPLLQEPHSLLGVGQGYGT